MKHNLTNEQTAIYDYLAHEKKASLVIDAKAGSGKTSTIVACSRLLPSGTIFLAFNKAIATELATRLTHPAMTFHSLGLSILRDRFSKVRVDNWKYKTLVEKKKYGTPRPYADLINAALTAGFGLANLPPLTPASLTELMEENQIDLPKEISEDEFIRRTLLLIKAALKDVSTITFSEMLYLPLYYAQKNKWSLLSYPCIVVDEAQDISPVRLALLTATTPRVIAVGDPCQAIYGFAGATQNILASVRKTYSAHSLPLTISFRCATSIIEEAQTIIGRNIFARPSAPLGTVDTAPITSLSFASLGSHSAILCRTNAPLFSLAVQLLAAGQEFNFHSDFPAALTRLATKIAGKTTSISPFLIKLETYLEEQAELHMDKRPSLFRRIADQVACIRIVANATSTLAELKDTLLSLTKSKTGLTLSTIHKSKGLEWDHVYLYRPDLIPAPWAESEWDIEQEHNLHYVAVTRAINHFTYLTDPSE